MNIQGREYYIVRGLIASIIVMVNALIKIVMAVIAVALY
jgi:hypothetical protein